MGRLIIFVRGNNGSGKSTVVRAVKNKFVGRPIYGLLGSKNPEAYECKIPAGYKLGVPFYKFLYILGPYESSASAGGDYATKKGVAATISLLQKYSILGNVIFESILTSIRFMEPSIGKWLTEHKNEVVSVSLKTSLEECRLAINIRQQSSIAVAHPSKHLIDNQKRFEGVSKLLEERGFRVEYASREDATDLVLRLLAEA